jgi:hypothetical protein
MSRPANRRPTSRSYIKTAAFNYKAGGAAAALLVHLRNEADGGTLDRRPDPALPAGPSGSLRCRAMNFDQISQSLAWLGLVDNPVLGWFQTMLAGWRAHPDVAVSSSIAALAVVLALASITQTRMVRRRLEAVKNEFFTALRPRFILRDVHAQSCKLGEPIEVTYTICNVGSSTAHIVESVLSVEVQQWNSPRRVPITGGKNVIGAIALSAGEATTLTYQVPERTWNKNLVKESDIIALIFCGRIGYVDASGVVRETSFCRAFDGSRERFFPLRDPELEYAD